MMGDIFDDFFDQTVLKMLIDRRRRLRQRVRRSAFVQNRDQQDVQRKKHQITAVGALTVGAVDEIVDKGHRFAAAGKYMIQKMFRDISARFKNDGQIGAGVIGGDTLIVKLSGAVNHALTGADIESLFIDGCR